MPSDPNVLNDYVYEMEIPRQTTNKKVFIPAPGVYKFKVLEVEPIKFQKSGKEGMRLYGKYEEYKDILTYIFVSLTPGVEWKIINLFKSAGLFDKCIKDGKFYTYWSLLDDKYIYPVVDNLGVKNFVTEDKYLMTK